MVQDQRTELATVKEGHPADPRALTSHVGKEDVIYEILKQVLYTAAFSARWVRVAPSAREQILGVNTA